VKRASGSILPHALAGSVVATLLGSFVFVGFLRGGRELTTAAIWGALVLAAFAGWGSLVVKGLQASRVDLGLRLVWGASALVAVGGVLASVGLYSRNAALLLVDVGLFAAAGAVWFEREALLRRARFTVRAVRRAPLVSTLLALVIGVALLQYLASFADSARNPYDDDIAYLAFVKKLLDTGTLLEPFSFRRISAYGGQTLLQSLLAPRVSFHQMNGFDRGMCVVIVVALVLGHRDRGRRVPFGFAALALAFFLTLPNTSINVAPHFSGVAFFLGLYRTVAWLRPTTAPWRSAVVVGLVAAGACTLRQNYLGIPVLFLAFVYAGRALRARGVTWRERLREPLLVAAVAALALVPWMVLAWRSNGTALFPLQLGTYRAGMDLRSVGTTPLKELRLLMLVGLENEPMKTFGILALAGAVVPDAHGHRPLRAFWVACAVGVLVLVHSFSLSDPGNLGRYLFGYIAALALAILLSIATQPRLRGTRDRVLAATVLAAAAVVTQLPYSRERAPRAFDKMTKDLDLAWRRPAPSAATFDVTAGLYHHVQSFVPAGARVAVLVDEPYLFDFARNDIFNLDMPGFASLKPDMPFFEGAEKLAAYFLAHDLRFLVVVRQEHSHWLYQREFWFGRIFNEEEIWRLCAPYFVDFLDNSTALRKTRKVLHEEAGIVVLDLAAASAAAGEPKTP
jgi:hypothetical protein